MIYFQDLLIELSQQQIILVAGICVFNLYKKKPKEDGDESECITEEESDMWHLVLTLSVNIMQLMVCIY